MRQYFGVAEEYAVGWRRNVAFLVIFTLVAFSLQVLVLK